MMNNEKLLVLLAVFFGGGLGSILRHYSILFWRTQLGSAFPYGTLFVNVLGSLVIGVIMEGAAQKWNITAPLQAFMVVGILGGFTTFSSFSLDVFKLAETQGALLASAYVGLSVFLSLLAVFGGAHLMRSI